MGKNKARHYRPVIFILAAGRGSRLKPLTYVMPKPLIPIGFGKRLIHWMFTSAKNTELPIAIAVPETKLNRFAFYKKYHQVQLLPTPLFESGSSFLHHVRTLRAQGYTHAIVVPADYYMKLRLDDMLNYQHNNDLDVCLLTSTQFPYQEYIELRNGKIICIHPGKVSSLSYIGIYGVKLDALGKIFDLQTTTKITSTEILNRLLQTGAKAGYIVHSSFWLDLGTWSRLASFPFTYAVHRIFKHTIPNFQKKSILKKKAFG